MPIAIVQSTNIKKPLSISWVNIHNYLNLAESKTAPPLLIRSMENLETASHSEVVWRHQMLKVEEKSINMHLNWRLTNQVHLG